jgi:hypothetical protein
MLFRILDKMVRVKGTIFYFSFSGLLDNYSASKRENKIHAEL